MKDQNKFIDFILIMSEECNRICSKAKVYIRRNKINDEDHAIFNWSPLLKKIGFMNNFMPICKI
jgi:hypothetical protein